MFFFFIFVSATCVIILNASTDCNDAYDDACASTTVSDSAIDCWGYSSCWKSSLTSTNGIRCIGSNSCYKADSMTIDTIGYCYGMYSCAETNSPIYLGTKIYCYGDSSCAGSEIDASTNIDCQGYRSCVNSPYMASKDIYVYGYLSGANTTFTNDGSEGYYLFYGTGSGHNATVKCVGTCSIDCYVNGCNNLNITCDSSSPSCTINLNCQYADESDICTKNENTNVVNVPDYVYHYLNVRGDIDQDVNDYNTTCSIHGGDYREYYDASSVSAINGSSCATGLL